MNGKAKLDSNIYVNSNVFYSVKDDPRCYDKFVDQIVDYEKLIQIKNRHNVDARVKELSEKQMAIVHTGIRCIYSKEDPCWGYDKKLKKCRCECINGKCPKIMECNPNYTKKIAEFWKKSEEDRKLYGNPEKQERYYLVDMVSDDEMLKYDVYPQNEGLEYYILKNPIKKEPVKVSEKVETMIDPATGRKMYAIGYRWVITDSASYESEKLVPIWGYIDDFKEEKVIKNKKAKIIEKLDKKVKVSIKSEKVESDEIVEIKNSISDKFNGIYKLTELNPEAFADKRVAIIVSNPAEKGYVESMLIATGIYISPMTNINVFVIQDGYNDVTYDEIWLSNNLMKLKIEDGYSVLLRLSELDNLFKLNISEREYFEILCNDGNSIWCCRNLYGITHICLNVEYFDIKKELDEGLYKIDVLNEDDKFCLNCNGELIGNLNEKFKNLLTKLENDDYLPGEIKKIKSISIIVHNKKLRICGIANLQFVRYW